MAILEAIGRWASSQKEVRAIIQTGSRAQKRGLVDELSDYDLIFFVTDVEKYTDDDAWISDIAEPWVVVHDETTSDLGLCFDNSFSVIPHNPIAELPRVQTRLIIFNGGVKVDIALLEASTLTVLAQMQQLPAMYDAGYSVLFDKDGIAQKIAQSTYAPLLTAKPTQEEFDTVVQEFFFEVYHVAKHLHRNDLWHAKFRDWATKEFLLTMIEWHELAHNGWTYDVCVLGKKMEKWVNHATWDELGNTFGHFDALDSWKVLEATVELFRKLASQTARKLDYDYPVHVDRNISTFAFEDLKKRGVRERDY